jgi:serine/threonine protein kinase/tetratricopeptide (TPR) repeat protein
LTDAGNRTLGHYRLLERIGVGGMGEVWRAIDLSLGRPVAIKLLPERLAADRDWLERFEREARVVAALNHPNIVTLHAIEQAGGQRFFTMELVTGATLADLLRPGGLPLARFFEIAVPLVDAVAAAHEHGVVHRDLKPLNVMVSSEGRVKVLDFGLAQSGGPRAPGPDGSAAADGGLSGTVSYMSPEQLAGAPVDERTDVFSLGVVLYEMLVGHHPFAGGSSSETAAAVLNRTPAPASEVRADVPLALSRVLRHCLEKDPGDRVPTARALEHELAELSRAFSASRRPVEPSIAVLPFADLSPGQDQAHLCEGLAEEVLHALTRLGGVRVASRSSSFRFRGGALSARAIGSELGVDALLEGSVRKSGERLRIKAELTSCEDGSSLWSERFDREMKDVFTLEDDIAAAIAHALELRLAPGERALAPSRTADVEAYESYLRGRHWFTQFRRKAVIFALEMFEAAARRDPGFALAHAGVAECHAFLWLYAERTEEHRAAAEAASERALALGPEHAPTHVSRGLALSVAGRYDEAEAEFQAALRLDPGLFEACYFYARDLFVRRRWTEAVGFYERAMALRPDDYQSPLLVAQIYEDLGRRVEADTARRRGIRVAEEHLARHPDDVRAMYMAANGMVALGENERGLQWADRAMALEPEDGVLLYNIACIRALAGQVEPALEVLERALRTGGVHLGWMQNDSNLDPLRAHPRFRDLMEWAEAGG